MTERSSSVSMNETTSSTWRARSTSGRARWARSPRPVRDGAYTVWPASRRRRATRLQHQPPCHAPWTRTKFSIVSDPCGGGRSHLVQPRFQSLLRDANAHRPGEAHGRVALGLRRHPMPEALQPGQSPLAHAIVDHELVLLDVQAGRLDRRLEIAFTVGKIG